MTRKPDPDMLARVITESAHQIWSAGLGALSMAEKEGSRFFETLTRLGENIHSQTRSTAEVARQTVSGGKTAATDTLEKIEEMFELRVARALNGLQIPTAQDVKELSERVDRLSRAVDALSAARDSKPKKSGKKKKRSGKKKKSGKKSAKKKSASRKTSKKKNSGKKKTGKKKSRKSAKKKKTSRKKSGGGK